jgi:hypothetical protein
MDTKKVDAKIDGAAKKAKDGVAAATSKGAEIATNANRAVAHGVAKVESAIQTGGERLQETAVRAKHVVEQAAGKLAHAAQETTQKALDGAKELAGKVEHRAAAQPAADSRPKQ